MDQRVGEVGATGLVWIHQLDDPDPEELIRGGRTTSKDQPSGQPWFDALLWREYSGSTPLHVPN